MGDDGDFYGDREIEKDLKNLCRSGLAATTATGALAGTMIAGPLGTAAGAALGAFTGYAAIFFGKVAAKEK